MKGLLVLKREKFINVILAVVGMSLITLVFFDLFLNLKSENWMKVSSVIAVLSWIAVFNIRYFMYQRRSRAITSMVIVLTIVTFALAIRYLFFAP